MLKILFESDRECTVDAVGLLEPGKPVEVDPIAFELRHGYKPTQANLPSFVKISVEFADEEVNDG